MTVAKGPCAGIRIVDMSSLISGPFCTQILCDLGAEVIRIEAPSSDPMRTKHPRFKDMGAMFEQVNRGKKSVSVNIKSEEGRQLVYGLVRKADMFIQNSRPGVMERLGFGYETLKKLNDRLIYLSVSGFGDTGPHANRPAYDMVIQGLTGFMPVQGRQQEPQAIRTTVADKTTAMWAANSALAALLHRERTGEGQKVSVDMTAAYAAFIMQDQLQNDTFEDQDQEPLDLGLASYDTLKTSDGAAIGMVMQPAQFERFCTALKRTDLIGDPRFADSASILLNGDAIYEEVADIVTKMTTAEFIALMNEAQVPFGKVNTVEEFMESEEALHCKVFVYIEDPIYGKIRHLNYPAKFERSPADCSRRAPLLGEHTEEMQKLIAEPAE